MEYTGFKCDPKNLLLDPNNYRFHDIESYKVVPNRTRYGEQGVQEKAIRLLQNTRSFELKALMDSIVTNGFVPFEQIVVEKFEERGSDSTYLVIEGNRRVAGVKLLLQDHLEGSLTLEPKVYESLQNLPVIEVLGSAEERRSYQQTLMAIRHIAGIREWGPYQQAKLVVELFENEHKQFGAVAQQVGISAREVARRYRASKALQQMEEDDEFSEYAVPSLYVFFHEAVSQPKVREWLGFSDDTYRAENESARRSFYELLSPRKNADQSLPPKLQSANTQVRQLKDIVDKPLPLQILLDPERSFEDAVVAAQQENTDVEAGQVEHALSLALNALRSVSIDAWPEPTEKTTQLFHDLTKLIQVASKAMTK